MKWFARWSCALLVIVGGSRARRLGIACRIVVVIVATSEAEALELVQQVGWLEVLRERTATRGGFAPLGCSACLISFREGRDLCRLAQEDRLQSLHKVRNQLGVAFFLSL